MAKLNIQHKEIIINILKQEISDLKAIYIFGSYASNLANKNSDIDIAFLSDKAINNLKIWEISNKIALKLLKDIDLVDLNSANTILKFQIISKGKRIYGNGLEIEKYESLVYSFYLRFKEERQSIVDAKIASNLGATNARSSN